MNGFIRTASYSRVSSQRQADERTIDSQLADIRDRASRDKNLIDPEFEYIDDGYSGSEMVRPALERLRDHIAGSMIDRLYIHSPDRLARNFAHQAILLEELKKHRCEVVFLNQEGLPDSPETKMLVNMQGLFAEYEREKIMERTRRGRRYAAAKGKVTVFSGAPYGYRYFPQSDEGDARWEVDPTESVAVRLIFEGVGQHGSTLAAVCRELHSQGIRTRSGKEHWSTSTVRGILRNPAYYGEARYGKKRLSPRKPGRRAKKGDPVIPRAAKVGVATLLEEQVMIRVPAIVSQSLFDEAGKRMEENRRRQRSREEGSKYLLSGLLICGQCGSAYCHFGSGKHQYYRCIGGDKYRYTGAPRCNSLSTKAAELELRVWTDLCDLLEDPERLKAEAARRQLDSSNSDDTLAKSRTKVRELATQINRLIDVYTEGLIERPEFESRIGNLRSRHDREATALASVQGRGNKNDPQAAAAVLAALAAEVKGGLQTASFELKRTLVKLLVDRIELTAGEIRIVYKVPQNPFLLSPDNRGFFQHWLSRQVGALQILECDDSSPPWMQAHWNKKRFDGDGS